jgi:hypothetical protein
MLPVSRMKLYDAERTLPTPGLYQLLGVSLLMS